MSVTSFARLGSANAYDNTLSNLTKRQNNLANLQESLTSGKKITSPSDDPTGAAQAERALNRLRDISIEVLDETASGEDVTDQYVDLQSQLVNLEATRERIKSFLEDAQNVDEALRINQQLSEIERQIEKAESMGLPKDPGVPAPSGRPDSYKEHLRLMMDMMVLAFKTDSTRISTFLLAHDGSTRSFKEIGVADGHHNISHHQKNRDNLEKLAKIDLFYMEQLAYLLDKLKNTPDVDGKSLLHNSMIVYGGCISDGDRHNHDDLPIVVAGNAGGAFTPGRHVDLGESVPLSNLYLRMLDEFGVKEKRIGDSTGALRKV